MTRLKMFKLQYVIAAGCEAHLGATIQGIFHTVMEAV